MGEFATSGSSGVTHTVTSCDWPTSLTLGGPSLSNSSHPAPRLDLNERPYQSACTHTHTSSPPPSPAVHLCLTFDPSPCYCSAGRGRPAFLTHNPRDPNLANPSRDHRHPSNVTGLLFLFLFDFPPLLLCSIPPSFLPSSLPSSLTWLCGFLSSSVSSVGRPAVALMKRAD